MAARIPHSTHLPARKKNTRNLHGFSVLTKNYTILRKGEIHDMKTKLRTKLICLIACLTMLIGSTVCASAEENTYLYTKADGTSETRTGAIPAVGDNGLPVCYRARLNTVNEVTGVTPAGNLIYGNWDVLYTPEQVALLYAAIDAAGITNEMPKYDKAVAINNYICSVYTYDTKGHLAWGDGLIVLQMGGFGACEEYADLYQTMCQAVGIECEVVVGAIGTAGHKWNAVYIDGKEYFVDVTWNDTGDGPMDEYLMSETNWDGHKFDAYEWQTWNEAEAILYQTRIREKRNYSPDDWDMLIAQTKYADQQTIDEVDQLIEQFGPFNLGATQFITINGQTIRIV